MSTTSLIPSLNYFILRESSRAKPSQVDFVTKCKPEKNQTKPEPTGLKRAISEPNLIMDRTDCFCSIDKKYKSLKLFKKRFNIFISSFSLIKFLKYVITFRHCRMSNKATIARKKESMGRSISLDWIDKKTFLIYKISHQLSKKSKLKNPNEKNKKKFSDPKTLSIKSIGSLLDTENSLGNTSRSHSCFTPHSANISLKASLANLNRIKHHDILEEAILNLNEIGGVSSFLKSFKKSESKRSFLSFRSANYDSKRKKNSSSCLSINDKIDLRDYVDKKSEINDNVLHRFLENKRAHARRFAICARIDKLDHNKELINFMEYLLREDYIQNFLM
ncbi:hypothetical protein BpHYR1_018667 [Brachionus plicatilis]|uniref:Uncharacterized protein n=1 Tax=Brachionus plicatilis TaxID=10195 RepID=A0A3M7T5G6_BRAPC|nr:hypothetical protein BpHYR1_018667 [Brachionus plicatilis]